MAKAESGAMDKQELRDALDRASWIDREFFRSFDVHDRMGLSGFSDEELTALNQAWLDPEVDGKFVDWLEGYDNAAYQRYQLQLSAMTEAIEVFTGISSIVAPITLSRARGRLND